MIVGIGADVVDLARFERAVSRTPKLAERLFAESERDRPLRSLAARFAAKEAVMKALGRSTGIRWHDMIVSSDEHGSPEITLGGAAKAIADDLGVTRLHLSLSHDAGVAIAMVVAEKGDAR
ncbi:holo-ACP synthase [Schumannella soli]|uniref:Holo-[acyl-carrier-protein] synthase n=1 Tax=Schumannella soli TaxID=2590779 RepID=A0A506XYE0_9MICO|nr:holo-ACP synthase [Schumannella soli]TPW74722.1 holo-ACP synthase [Schumannella soli]